jgi:Spy/CpxP family protein refolding chaperone
MKKLITIIGIVILVGAFAYPAFSRGPGWGRGSGHMMGFWDRDYAYDRMGGRGYGYLDNESREKLDQLNRRYYEKTSDFRNRLYEKSDELDALLAGPYPDGEMAKGLEKELSDLRAQLDQERLDYELEARKITPDIRSGRGYGRGMRGRGFGMGYGPGACWR